MDTVRYCLAWILVVLLPPAILYWFVIHPFAAFWRRVGRWSGLAAGFAVLIGSAIALARVAPALLTIQYGFSWLLAVPGIALFCLALVIQFRRRKYLTLRILMGVPEMSPEPGASVLLREGIYSRIRHPRYVEVMSATLGYALVANYLAGYVAIAVSALLIHLLVVVEERELRARFGREWEGYAAHTPRFVPRWRG